MKPSGLWIALGVLVLIVLVLPVLAGGLLALAAGPIAHAASGWGWGSGWCGY